MWSDPRWWRSDPRRPARRRVPVARDMTGRGAPMPTYEYRCGKCSHQFELFQSMTARPKRTCPSCGRAALERLIGTGAAIVFKGSGFYQTDYRSDSYKKAAEADSPAQAAKGSDGAAPSSPPPPSNAPASSSSAETSNPADSNGPQSKDSTPPVAAKTSRSRTTQSPKVKPSSGVRSKERPGGVPRGPIGGRAATKRRTRR